MKDFKSVVLEVKNAYNIVDYIEGSGVSLRSNGTESWKGLCPFHSEKTPSFTVSSARQSYKCFGCGASGDILSFVMATENIEFKDALLELAEAKNINVDFSGNSDSSFDYASLRKCVKDSANFFYKNFKSLPSNHPAKKEITSRGLSPKGGMLYGYAPEGGSKLYSHLSSLGYSDEIIFQSGVCRKSKKSGRVFDFWQGRLMFFLTDTVGRPVGFSGRKLFETDRMGKYVNSPDGILFDKSSILFNFSDAKKSAGKNREIYIAEGQFDVAAIRESGVENVAASSGTAFTVKQAHMCSRSVGEGGKIIFCFDGDNAGREAALKVFDHCPQIHGNSYVVSFPEGNDPCDYRQKNGSEELKKYIEENRKPLVEFVLESFAEGKNFSQPQDKMDYIQKSAVVLKSIDNLSLREHYVKLVSINTLVETSVIEEAVKNAKLEKKNREVYEAEITNNDVERYESTDVEERLIETLSEGFGKYYISHRLLFFFSEDRAFCESVDDFLDYVPSEMRPIFEELCWIPLNEPVFPEKFTYSEYISNLFEKNYFPFLRIMDMPEKEELYNRLVKELKEVSQSFEVEKVRMKISRALSDGKSSVDILRKALEKEEELIGRVN